MGTKRWPVFSPRPGDRARVDSRGSRWVDDVALTQCSIESRDGSTPEMPELRIRCFLQVWKNAFRQEQVSLPRVQQTIQPGEKVYTGSEKKASLPGLRKEDAHIPQRASSDAVQMHGLSLMQDIRESGKKRR
jgi:hypothetical protein